MKKRRGRLKPPSPDIGGGPVDLPFVAIVGRPNVGKSTLFNRLIGQRLAITEPTAGTTRDRLAAIVELDDGRLFELCDTGGLGGTGDQLDLDVNRQIDVAVEFADLIVFVVDARAGLIPLDEKIARRLKKLQKPILLVANKVESGQLEATSGEFYALGMPGDVHAVSALEGTGRTDLLEALAALLPEPEELDQAETGPEDDLEAGREVTDAEDLAEEQAHTRLLRVAIVGRRNVGKSTYLNQLFGSERVIVSDLAGTTRDAIDVRVTVGGHELILIDTAGLRRKGKADDHIEIISHGRAQLALRRCDVALLFLDCIKDISSVDKKIAGMIESEHKTCVIVANKWDLVDERMTLEDYGDYVASMIPNQTHAPVVSISAKEGHHATTPVEVAFELYRQSLIKVGTGPLNRALTAALTLRRPKPVKNLIGKVYFGTQVATNPVTILLFVNEPRLFKQAYRRYLANQLRKHTPWKEVPIKLVFRARQSLYKKGGGLARRVKRLSGLAEQARWVDDQPTSNVHAIESALDEEDVRAALLDVFSEDEEGDDVFEDDDGDGEDGDDE